MSHSRSKKVSNIKGLRSGAIENRMCKLTLSFSIDDVPKVLGGPVTSNVETLDMLCMLRQGPDQFVAICNVVLKDKNKRAVILRRGTGKVSLLETTKKGVNIYLVKLKVYPGSFNDVLLKGANGYIIPSVEVRGGKVTISLIADSKQIRVLVRKLDRTKIPYKIVSVQSADFRSYSPLCCLTDKQRQVLITAYEQGYYNIPKRTSTRKIAAELGIDHSTFSVHRLKAERNLLKCVLENENKTAID